MPLQNSSRGLEKFFDQCEKETPVQTLKITHLHFDEHFQILKGSVATVISISKQVTCTKRKDVILDLPPDIPIQNLLDVSRNWFVRAIKISSGEYKVQQFIRPIDVKK
ncbi:MAG: hypothetical protein ACFFC7_05690 [Candidatus Hermodarchaeota archaeon]